MSFTHIKNGKEYLLLLPEERSRRLREYCEENFEYFSIEFLKEVIDTDYTERFMRDLYYDMHDSYAQDIEDEKDEEFGTRLAREMQEAGVVTVDDFIDYLVEREIDEGYSGIESYIFHFGESGFLDLLRHHTHLLDFEEMARLAAREDGYGHFFAGYDGEEREMQVDNVRYYAYRID